MNMMFLDENQAYCKKIRLWNCLILMKTTLSSLLDEMSKKLWNIHKMKFNFKYQQCGKGKEKPSRTV